MDIVLFRVITRMISDEDTSNINVSNVLLLLVVTGLKLEIATCVTPARRI